MHQRLAGEKKRAWRKLLVFYVTYMVIFLVLPLVLLYLLFSFSIWLYRSIKLGR